MNDSDMVTTGVAKGRDRLDSATSTSSIKENEIVKLAPRSMADLFRNIPGIRVEAAAGEGGNSYTVRGLPLVNEGAKYLQIQEDGLPVLEFGDFVNLQPDSFARVDLNIAQVESIRGGSSSTFASNAPGGVINLISKTGEVEGGSVQTTAGVNYETYRLDFDYGGHLSENWRFHVGGFYREGEGPRRTGFNGYRGGQVKMNVTRQFDGGYIRFYGKLLDDRSPLYRAIPVSISGSNDDPKFGSLPGFDINRDSVYSSNIGSVITAQPDGSLAETRYQDGVHAKVKSGGVEAQFTLAGWTVTERFRYLSNSLVSAVPFPAIVGAPALLGGFLQLPGVAFSYASGPQTGQPFDPARGTGLLAITATTRNDGQSLDNVTNDLRASRGWQLAGGNLTTTLGVYKARQQLQSDRTITTLFQSVEGNGQSSLINVAAAGGLFPISQNGTFSFSALGNPQFSNSVDVAYDVLAPYGSFNFSSGRLSVGGSLRYDTGQVEGHIQSALPTAVCVDVNRDGVTIPGTAECQTARFATGGATPVNYDYNYLSYSTGVNFRVSEPFALFARAYKTVGLFVQVRPVDRLELSLNASNVFNEKAVTETLDATFPVNNVALARTLYGRLISGSARFFF